MCSRWPALGRQVSAALLLSCALALPALAAPPCPGDCNGTGMIGADDVVTLVQLALSGAAASSCAASDADRNSTVTVSAILAAINTALIGCPLDPCPQYNAQRNLYFGDLHVHTTNSFDAHLWDVRTTPRDAYRFARGEALSLPPLDAEGHGTRTVHLERPLDFAAVTDHAEFLGEVESCSTPGSASYDSSTCQQFRAGGNDIFAQLGVRVTQARPTRIADVCGADGKICLDAAGEVWQRIRSAAEDAYDRCQFTAFVAYEYSRALSGSTMHRNVIFRSAQASFPISTFEQPTPLGLWRALKASCTDAGIGCDVLAIPHNSNESNGRMFAVSYPGAQGMEDEQAQALLRANMEPLVEIYQHKGNSECFNGLSGVVGATDEQCDFERRRQGTVVDCGNGVGQLGATGNGCVSRLDYVRGVLLAGLTEADRLGVNPYRLGFVGSTDTHNGTPGFTDEWAFIGHQGASDAPPEVLLGHTGVTAGGVIFSPGALTGVWAEENSRTSLFDALRRKEAFATSGTRIAVRVFGGWELPDGLCDDPDLVSIGYAEGVPMGGTLAPRPADATAPVLVINAARDPGSDAHPGGKLQRLQVVKGWVADGQAYQQVYDVAGSADNGATVDLATCTPQGPGADSLCTVWHDPDFDPSRRAFYYVRVLENPACRWTTWTCNRLPPEQRQPTCDDPAVPKTIQERAWTSPIWYTPPA